MVEQRILFPTRRAAVDAVSRTIDSVSRELFVYMTADITRYFSVAIASTFWERLPGDLDRFMRRLMNNIPQDALKRYDRLKRIGDIVVCFHEYLGLSSFVSESGIAQCCYDDASRIGKKLCEREAPVLESIAENFDDYALVLRGMRGRLVA